MESAKRFERRREQVTKGSGLTRKAKRFAERFERNLLKEEKKHSKVGEDCGCKDGLDDLGDAAKVGMRIKHCGVHDRVFYR